MKKNIKNVFTPEAVAGVAGIGYLLWPGHAAAQTQRNYSVDSSCPTCADGSGSTSAIASAMSNLNTAWRPGAQSGQPDTLINQGSGDLIFQFRTDCPGGAVGGSGPCGNGTLASGQCYTGAFTISCHPDLRTGEANGSGLTDMSMHEFGHGIGMPDNPGDSGSFMNPVNPSGVVDQSDYGYWINNWGWGNS